MPKVTQQIKDKIQDSQFILSCLQASILLPVKMKVIRSMEHISSGQHLHTLITFFFGKTIGFLGLKFKQPIYSSLLWIYHVLISLHSILKSIFFLIGHRSSVTNDSSIDN